ncbi:SigB/SigF/SigG family RNA polymerase sigma factor [Streptomyces sp. NPDC026672]|uniref:SigB/SigF/SigG family RNA polymerase sigma factor n=1 Tax=unclassified Streptomyces TaxID=2593676 RepID=UPI0033FCA5CB
MRATTGTRQHPHDDAPDTAGAFARLATLPDGPERHALRDELVRLWLPMAERIAVRFRGRGESDEDLHQVAALGLVKAVDRFDPDRGRPFEAYAVPTITGEIKRHFRDHMWDLHVPRRVQELRNQVRVAVKELAPTTSHGIPTVAEIAGRTRLSESDVRTGLEALECFSTLSTDAEVPGTEGHSLADVLGSPDQSYDTVVDRLSAAPRLRSLPERERTILYLRFFCDMTQGGIAERMGISQMHVSRLLNHCFAQVREEVLADAS